MSASEIGTDRSVGRHGGVQSVEIGASILYALARFESPASLTDISTATGLVPAKLHRYLASMMKTGLVTQTKRAGLYSLGTGAVQIGLSAVRQNDVCTMVAERLIELRDKLDVTCFGAVMGNMGPTVFSQALATRNVAVFVRVGSVMPMDRSATGWVFGTFISDGEYELVFGSPRNSAPAALQDRFDTVRTEGCARITDEYVRGISAVACPIFDIGNNIQAVVTALGPTGNFDNSLRGEIARILLESCAEISSSLGHTRQNTSPN